MGTYSKVNSEGWMLEREIRLLCDFIGCFLRISMMKCATKTFNALHIEFLNNILGNCSVPNQNLAV